MLIVSSHPPQKSKEFISTIMPILQMRTLSTGKIKHYNSPRVTKVIGNEVSLTQEPGSLELAVHQLTQGTTKLHQISLKVEPTLNYKALEARIDYLQSEVGMY